MENINNKSALGGSPSESVGVKIAVKSDVKTSVYSLKTSAKVGVDKTVSAGIQKAASPNLPAVKRNKADGLPIAKKQNSVTLANISKAVTDGKIAAQKADDTGIETIQLSRQGLKVTQTAASVPLGAVRDAGNSLKIAHKAGLNIRKKVLGKRVKVKLNYAKWRDAKIKLHKTKKKLNKLKLRGFVSSAGIKSLFNAADGAFSSMKINSANAGDTGVEAVKFSGQAYVYGKAAATTVKDAATAPVKIVKTSRNSIKTIRNIPNEIRKIKRTTKTTANAAKTFVKQSYKAGKFAAQKTIQAAKFVAQAARVAASLAAKAAAALASNPYVLAAVGGAAAFFLIITSVSNSGGGLVSAANATINYTIGWLISDDGNIDSSALLSQLDANKQRVNSLWNSYARNIIDSRTEDEVSSNDSYIASIDKTNILAIIFVKKLKTNPNLKIEDI